MYAIYEVAAFLNSIDFRSAFGIPGLGKNRYCNPGIRTQ
jgi:hypothetical protein